MQNESFDDLKIDPAAQESDRKAEGPEQAAEQKAEGSGQSDAGQPVKTAVFPAAKPPREDSGKPEPDEKQAAEDGAKAPPKREKEPPKKGKHGRPLKTDPYGLWELK